MISQGNISSFAEAKPIDRRGIFEEAAGIAKFKDKKNQAEKKLLNTQDNLNRINDLITEIDRQLKPLREQAETAKIYHDLKDQLKVLEVNMYIHQYDTASDTKNAILEKINAIVEELEEVVKYAHLYGVKVYVTMNTMLLEDEIEPGVIF